MKKLIIAIIISIILFISPIFVKGIFAADLYVSCLSGCTKSGIDPLFSKSVDGFWYPGKEVTKVINLTNLAGEKKEMIMKASRSSSESILEDVISIEISNPVSLATIWQGSLSNFYIQDKISFGTFDSNQSSDFNFKVKMDPDSNNDYQSLKSVFDLKLGFWQEESTQGNNSNPGGTGDGLSDGRSDGKSDGKSSGAGGVSAILGAAVSPIVGELREVLGINTKPSNKKPEILGKDLDNKINSENFWIKKTYLIGLLLFIILILLYIFRKSLKTFILRNKK